jgi:hypothetical protein
MGSRKLLDWHWAPSDVGDALQLVTPELLQQTNGMVHMHSHGHRTYMLVKRKAADHALTVAEAAAEARTCYLKRSGWKASPQFQPVVMLVAGPLDAGGAQLLFFAMATLPSHLGTIAVPGGGFTSMLVNKPFYALKLTWEVGSLKEWEEVQLASALELW